MFGVNLFRKYPQHKSLSKNEQTKYNSSTLVSKPKPIYSKNIDSPSEDKIKILSSKQDLSWQQISLDTLKEKSIYKTNNKKKIGRKTINLDQFTIPNGNSIILAPNLGANILNLQLKGKSIIQSPLMKNQKVTENYVPKIQGAPLISPPNRTNNSKIYLQNGKTINLIPWHTKIVAKTAIYKKKL